MKLNALSLTRRLVIEEEIPAEPRTLALEVFLTGGVVSGTATLPQTATATPFKSVAVVAPYRTFATVPSHQTFVGSSWRVSP